jgi:hypothetical protein
MSAAFDAAFAAVAGSDLRRWWQIQRQASITWYLIERSGSAGI